VIVKGTAWVSDGDDYWAENAACDVEVQRTDDNEVRLGVQLTGRDFGDEATVYLTLGEASRLAHMLGIYVLAHEAAAHEATKYGAPE